MIDSCVVQPMPLSEQNGQLRGYIVSYQQTNLDDDVPQLLYTNVTYASIGLVVLRCRPT